MIDVEIVDMYDCDTIDVETIIYFSKNIQKEKNYCLYINSTNNIHIYKCNINHFNKYQKVQPITSIFNQVLNIIYLINY